MTIFYTYADKRPDFIPLQYESLKHFVQGEFKYVIFNNGSSSSLTHKIRQQAESIGVECLDVPWKRHWTPHLACAYPIQWSWKKHLSKNAGAISCIIDSDMFLIAPFNPDAYMQDMAFAGVKQRREHIKYIWNGIMLFKSDQLPEPEGVNFMYGKIDGIKTDVGGKLYPWLKRNPGLKFKNIYHTSHIWSGNKNMDCLPVALRSTYLEDFRFEIYDHVILHYGRGSNWDRKDIDYHKVKTEFLHTWVNGAIKGDITLPHYDYIFQMDAWKD